MPASPDDDALAALEGVSRLELWERLADLCVTCAVRPLTGDELQRHVDVSVALWAEMDYVVEELASGLLDTFDEGPYVEGPPGAWTILRALWASLLPWEQRYVRHALWAGHDRESERIEKYAPLERGRLLERADEPDGEPGEGGK
jgi:hypothetical protein